MTTALLVRIGEDLLLPLPRALVRSFRLLELAVIAIEIPVIAGGSKRRLDQVPLCQNNLRLPLPGRRQLRRL